MLTFLIHILMILHARVRDIQLRKISSEIAIEYCSFISRQKQLATANFLKTHRQAFCCLKSQVYVVAVLSYITLLMNVGKIL